MDNLGRIAPAERPADVEVAAEQPEELPVVEQEHARSVERPAAAEATPETDGALPTPAQVRPPPTPRDPLVVQIENILQDGVFEAYLAMGPTERQSFKTRGEDVADRIRQMVAMGKVQAKKIWQLIREWLRLIPGVSALFVEQEAKIKTDRIVLLARTGMH